ncbi:nucleotidyltransferase [Lachnospiraceae bacterium NSJ-143]|nr:nucleotidyltransferase [Lachnospiraceae bacterium NSJ-143]
MLTAGITAEYNPFHNGHKYHIEKTREITGAEYIVSVMSGNFVQRGEPALFDKWTRTLFALKNGADLVVELPSFFSCSSAEYFASAAVSIMESSGIIDFISFGSESKNISELTEFSKAASTENEEFKRNLKLYLSKGLSYPLARENALKNSGISTPVFSANNILATEYLKAVAKLGSKIKPVSVTRTDNGYNSLETKDTFASATYLRKIIAGGGSIEEIMRFVPENIANDIKNSILSENTVFPDDMSHILNFVLRNSSLETLRGILDVREGIENKIFKSLNDFYSFSDITAHVKSKRYSFTGIQRILLHIMLNMMSKDMLTLKENGYCQYIRVLGFRKESAALLGRLADKSSVPLIINVKKDELKLDGMAKFLFNFEKKSDDIYYMCSHNSKNRYPNHDYTVPPVII